MICVHCGKEIDNGQAFCPYCGSRVGGDAAPEAKAAKKDPRKLALPVAAVALLAVVGVWLGTDDVCNIIGERTFGDRKSVV